MAAAPATALPNECSLHTQAEGAENSPSAQAVPVSLLLHPDIRPHRSFLVLAPRSSCFGSHSLHGGSFLTSTSLYSLRSSLWKEPLPRAPVPPQRVGIHDAVSCTHRWFLGWKLLEDRGVSSTVLQLFMLLSSGLGHAET